MRTLFLVIIASFSLPIYAQQERDTVLSRCPVFITDTVSSNNFFLEFQQATVKVYRAKGNLTIRIQQKDQFFTIFFNTKKLKSTKYKIVFGANNRDEVEAKYSFRSGVSASYVDVSSGTIESLFDKEKDLWHIKLNGMLANLVDRSVTYYRVKADFYIK
jgi:C-terminal processing protease CtpA/Prc